MTLRTRAEHHETARELSISPETAEWNPLEGLPQVARALAHRTRSKTSPEPRRSKSGRLALARARARRRARSQVGIAVPDPDAPRRSWPARYLVGERAAGRAPSSPPLSPDGRRDRIRDRASRGQAGHAAPGQAASELAVSLRRGCLRGRPDPCGPRSGRRPCLQGALVLVASAAGRARGLARRDACGARSRLRPAAAPSIRLGLRQRGAVAAAAGRSGPGPSGSSRPRQPWPSPFCSSTPATGFSQRAIRARAILRASSGSPSTCSSSALSPTGSCSQRWRQRSQPASRRRGRAMTPAQARRQAHLVHPRSGRRSRLPRLPADRTPDPVQDHRGVHAQLEPRQCGNDRHPRPAAPRLRPRRARRHDPRRCRQDF